MGCFWARGLLCVVALLHVGGVAWADEATERAKEHNAAGKKLFNLGRFHEAANAYSKAYEAKPVPALLYNLAQCHRRAGGRESLEKALFYLQAYLNNAPFSPIRAAAEKEKVEIEAQLNKPPQRIYQKWWFWTAVGTAVLTAVTVAVVVIQPDDPMHGNAEPGIFQLP